MELRAEMQAEGTGREGESRAYVEAVGEAAMAVARTHELSLAVDPWNPHHAHILNNQELAPIG